MPRLELILLVGGAMLLAAAWSTRLSRRFGAPAMLVFVAIGMLAGSSGPGGIVFDNYELTYNVGIFALLVIVFAGGLETDLRSLRDAIVPAGLLASVGVLVKAGVVAVAMRALGAPWSTSLLLGAILAPTDAAAVFSVVKGNGLPPRIAGTLETESGTNDPVSIYLTMALTLLVTGHDISLAGTALGMVVELALGVAYGWFGGVAVRWLLAHSGIEALGLYPVLAFGGAFAVFGLSELAFGNGLLAVYVTGVVIGHGPTSAQKSITNAADTAAWAAQLSVFLLLGLLVFPERIPPVLGPAVIVALVSMIVGRPLAVAVSLLPMRIARPGVFRWRDYLVLAWGGLKGAVPIILAIVPLLHGYTDGDRLFHFVFVVVLLCTALQGMTLIPLARWLGVLEPEPPEPLIRLEFGGPVAPEATLSDVALTGDMPAVGSRIQDIELPDDVAIVTVLRDGHVLVPRGPVVLHAGDHVYILASPGAEIGQAFTPGAPRTRAQSASDADRDMNHAT